MPKARIHPRSYRLVSLAASFGLLAGLLAAGAPASLAASPPPTPTHRLLDDQSGAGTDPGSKVSPKVLTAAVLPGLPAGFSDSIIFSGLNQPSKIAFGPDGKIWVAQKAGKIYYFNSLSDPTAHLFADLSSEVNSYWDRGLMGLAVSPGYTTNHTIYIQYAWDHNPVSDLPGNPYNAPVQWNDSCPANPGALTDGCPILGHISALTATSGGSAWTGTEQVLVSGWCQQFPSHSDDDLWIGPDGDLYATAGDGSNFTGADWGQDGGTSTPVITPANPCADPPGGTSGVALTTPSGEGGALRAQSARRTDSGAVLNGALIRIDPATGNGVAGNPFYSGDGSNNASRLLAFGLRNPYRFTFRPGTNQIWLGDVGYNTYEEINKITLPLTQTSANFGWPCVEGPQAGTYYGGTALALCTSLASSAAPYYYYNHNSYLDAADQASGACPPGSSSISGDAFYEGSSYPPAYKGALFFGDHSRNCLWAMLPGSNGDPDPTKIVTFVSANAGVVDVVAGPDGNIMYVNYDNGTIHEIAYGAPSARETSDVTSGIAPLTVHFDGSASSGNAPPLSYSWNVPGAACDDLTSITPTCVFGGAGVDNVRLTVTDANGAFSISDPLPISVGGASAPTLSIDTVDGNAPPPVPPLDANGFPNPIRQAGYPAIYSVGSTITFAGHATDYQGNPIPPGGLSWQIDILHCPSNCHDHSLQTIAGAASGSVVGPDHDYPSLLRLTLTATDGGGLSASASSYLYPNIASVTVQSDPVGVPISAGTLVNVAAPFTGTYLAGGNVTLGAPLTTTLGSSRQQYAFSSWSDGGSSSHSVTAAGQTLVAHYSQIQTSAYLSDLTPTFASNGWGPYERDMSNGEQGPGDGGPITLAGIVYPKGLGTNAPADLRYAIDGSCSSFSALLGIDADALPRGSVIFQVWLDGIKTYDSGPMLGGSAPKSILLPVAGAAELRLVVTDGGDGGTADHADWAMAKVTCGVPPLGAGLSLFTPIAPTRILDTRSNLGLTGKFKANQARTIKVAGLDGIPADATAVSVNLTVTGQSAAGYLALTTTPNNAPLTSSLNFPKGDTRANGAIVPIAPDGTISLTYVAGNGSVTDAVIDVTGAYDSNPIGSGLRSISPTRILDTRSNLGLTGKFKANQARTIKVAGLDGIPADATAVSVNLTVTGQSAAGYLALTQTPVNHPGTSSLNFPKGDTRANGAIVPIAPDGTISLTYVAGNGASTSVVMDITGAYAPEALAAFTPLAPTRFLDTRSNLGLAGKFKANQARTLQITGVHGIPADASAVAVNLTVTGQSAAGYLALTTIPINTPGTSTLNFPLGDTRANNAVITLNSNGTLSITLGGPIGSSSQVILDLVGYFSPTS